MDLVFLSVCIPVQALGMHFAQPHFLDPSHCFDLFQTGMWSLQPCILSEHEKAILLEVDLPHDPCVTASFVYKFPRVCLCGGTRNKTGDLSELHIPPQNACANPGKGTCTGWQHLRVDPAQWSAQEFPASSQDPSHWIPAPAEWGLLQCKGLTCILYPPRFCKLGIRRDGLSFTYGDIFHKWHGGDIDIWTLEIIVGSNGSL